MPIKPREASEATANRPAVEAVPENIAIHCRRIRRAMKFPKAASSLSIPEENLPLSPVADAQILQAVFNLNHTAAVARAKNAKPKSDYRRSAARRKASKSK